MEPFQALKIPSMTTKSWIQGMLWSGRSLKAHPVPSPTMGWDTFHYPKLFQAPSNLALLLKNLLFLLQPRTKILDSSMFLSGRAGGLQSS